MAGETCSSALNTFHTDINAIAQDQAEARLDLDKAYADWWDNQDRKALQRVILAGYDICDALRIITGYGSPFTPITPLEWFMRNCVGVGTIDMSAIIQAMLVANSDEIEYFVGLSDAFRQSIWNRPFNQEMFAALARGFQEWG